MSKKIGLIDSGIGGMSLLQGLLQRQLDARYFYLCDPQNMPYGNKEQPFVFNQIEKMVQELLSCDVELIIIACNTATAETINKLRQIFPIPFIGMEPYLNIINQSLNKEASYALILTQRTFESQRFQQLQKRLDPQSKISLYPLKNLASIIEKLKQKPLSEIEEDLKKELEPIRKKKHTHLILGCTHYPLIKGFLSDFLGLKIIDSTEQVIKRVKEVTNLEQDQNEKSFFYKELGWKSWENRHLKDIIYLT